MSALTRVLPGQPHDESGPVFHEPWQAQAFAMVLALYERGLFSWTEWAHILAAEISRAEAGGAVDVGDTYYHHWLSALETLVASRGVASGDELMRYRCAWDHASLRTPHGQPIELMKADFAA